MGKIRLNNRFHSQAKWYLHLAGLRRKDRRNVTSISNEQIVSKNNEKIETNNEGVVPTTGADPNRIDIEEDRLYLHASDNEF